MFYKRHGIPEEGSLLICTIKKILSHSVFVELDEYNNLEGMLHISEVSPGRIRNLRDFVSIGKKIVCKVISAKDEKHIDVSLRRVPMNQRIERMNSYKQEIKAERMLEFIARDLKLSIEEMYKKFAEKAINEYGSLSSFFYAVFNDNSILKKIGVEDKIAKPLLELINEKIKIPEIEISGTLVLQSFKEDGVSIIKKVLTDEIKDNINITYLSAPKYRVSIKSKDYKTAENILKQISDRVIEGVKKQGGTGEFIRNA